tara:strand:- start:184 stop:375 length:192 start_codon:yes stop_codon:yes gene_type:complete
MKLFKIDFYLDWPVSVDVINLRKFIMKNLMQKGQVIRWSIIEIQNKVKEPTIKKLRIFAVLAD